MLMTNKKNQNPLLYLLINCISSRSAPKILSLKDERTFHFPHFVIIGLRSSSADYWFSGTTSELIPLTLGVAEAFSQITCKPMRQVHLDIHHIIR